MDHAYKFFQIDKEAVKEKVKIALNKFPKTIVRIVNYMNNNANKSKYTVEEATSLFISTGINHLANSHHTYGTMRLLYIHIRYHENKLKTFGEKSIRNEDGKLSEDFIKKMINFNLPDKFYTSPSFSVKNFWRTIFLFSNPESEANSIDIIQNYEDRIVMNKSSFDNKSVPV